MKVQSAEIFVRAAQSGPYLGFDFSLWRRANLTCCVSFYVPDRVRGGQILLVQQTILWQNPTKISPHV